ncbi:hypothetical protein BB032_03440 [Neisseria gonorrhoeae]|nr:hypothetical protein A9Y61_07875 [Neisseria gonorrhoeae]EFE04857.1 conserved hypothetical protein [Neisseria gonorrhoeae DGI2]KMM30016.1 hypothetical protein ACI80_02750 [Neisseria gonorrhoeae]KXI25301.1 hypothetical protein AUP00_07245 [Neisseria gonorrhoeae]OHZ49777.1 hypothetical protein BBZ83_04575 [Neisseria gonorrhoeae]
MIEMSKDYRNDLYDVYVSYPPQVDRGLIRECLKENLGEEKAEGLIESLDSKPQVLVEEKCTWAKREELHDYFSYLGLDIITRIWSWKRSCRRRRGRAKEEARMGKCPNILNFTAGGKMIFPHLRNPSRRPAISNRWFSGC